jgi:hypothetical protein
VRKADHGVESLRGTVLSLVRFWSERSESYNNTLPHFSRYYLKRLEQHTIEVAALVTELGLSVPQGNVVDVGSGLVPWSLPFLDFSRDCTLHAFDVDPTIARAFSDGQAEGLLPERLRFHFEDYTVTTRIPAQSVGTIICCDALNYISILKFICKSQELSLPGSSLLLLVQTDGYNYSQYMDSLSSGDIARATQLAVSTLRQTLVRNGFSSFLPRRTTHSIPELIALFSVGGFEVERGFCPIIEGRPGDRLQGLVLRFTGEHATADLSRSERLRIRKLVCASGFSDYDDDRFVGYSADVLEDGGLLLLKTRAHGSSLNIAGQCPGEVAIADAVLRCSVADVWNAVTNTKMDWPHLLAGVMLAIQAGEIQSAVDLFARTDARMRKEQSARLCVSLLHLLAKEPEMAIAVMSKGQPKGRASGALDDLKP